MYHTPSNPHLDQILGLVPIYQKDQGDTSLIYLKDQITTSPLPIQSYLKEWAQYYFIDPGAMTSYFRSQGLSGPIPLYLGGRIYVSLKVRKPKVPGDRCYGYLAYKAIEGLQGQTLYFAGHTLRLACTQATATKAIQNGVLVQNIIQSSSRFIFKKD